MPNKISDWRFHDTHVQDGIMAAKFASSETTLLSAGPAFLKEAEIENCYPLGVLENVVITQSQQLMRLFEIGSSLSYTIPGRSIGAVNLARAYYYGPSLLKVLYAAYQHNDLTPDTDTPEGVTDDELDKVESGQMWCSLWADIFHHPIGLMFIATDQIYGGGLTSITQSGATATGEVITTFYLEECYIGTHQFGINAGAVVLTENASMEFSRVVPVTLTATT